MRIGIDLGGMSVKYGLVNERNEIIARHVIPTNIEISAEDFIKEMCKGVHDLLETTTYTIKDVKSIGVGSPGVINIKEGVVIYSNNFGWVNVPLVKLFQEEFNLPIGIANDADAAALGEATAGAAKGAQNAVLLTLGTGVGSGVIMNGEIFQGPLNGGCELGHMTIKTDGVRCTCGNVGCLEAYASATGLMRLGREAVEANPSSMLALKADGNLESINGKLIFDCKEASDEVAMQVVDEYLHYVAVGVATVINSFRPEMVILGGGVSAQKEKLTNDIQERIKKIAFGAEFCEMSKVVTSELGNDAGIIGAAHLV